MKAVFALFAVLVSAAGGANPYLDLKDDQPVAATYTGKEWGDDVKETTDDGADFSAKVTTQRVAVMPWGQIVRVSFAPKSARKVEPLLLLVTDGEILLLETENPEKEIQAIVAMKKQPKFEQADVRALSKGALEFSDGPWTTKVTMQDGTCRYLSSHNSGHFTRFVWKKGGGLLEYARGSGAMADGFRLKAPRKK